MKRLIIVATGLIFAARLSYGQESEKQLYLPDAPVPAKYKVDTRIDNMGYWNRMASLGLVPVAPERKAPLGKFTGSLLSGRSIATEDSPDVQLTTETSTQSENSVFVDPNNSEALLQSNNSTTRPVSGIYGANDFLSSDAGITWTGELEGAGGENSGDPATAIGLNGWYYVGYIHSSGGQGVSYSQDQGQNWTPVLVAPSPGGWSSLLDKNHLWIDNSSSSAYAGYLYDAWTNFGGSNDSEIEISRSTNEGISWSSAVSISNAVNAGSHNQGVNIHTGPDGEVYVIWAIYDGWPTDESAIGMARSFDGGATWQPATRIISNIRGIRTSGTSKNMRVNSFPSMTVDISNGSNRGTLYVTWANTGTPGINTGNDIDVYMIKSTDQGESWSAPVKVNQDESGMGKEHYLPWITCDPANGNVSVIYYDDRNVNSNQCETYVSTSTDGGFSWEDLKVSDVSFTPQPISGLADSYFGDYIAIQALNRWVYPVWTDNRNGYAMAYVSPFQTGPPPDQPWIIHNAHQINDITGNNNGLLDFGESLNFDISMENIGDQPASAVEVVLSTDSPYITITDNTEQFGDFAVGEIKSVTAAYSLDVSPEIPDGESVIFTLTATDAADSTFTSNFIVEAHAPDLRAGSVTINDAQGNGNGRLDPGERVILNIVTSNPGDYDAENVTAQLNSPSQFISFDNSTADLGTIHPGLLNAVNAQFQIQVAPETPVGHAANFNFTAVSQALTATKSFTLSVGLILEDWESGNFENFDWQFAGTAPWSIATDQVWEGENSSKSGDISDNQSSEMSLYYNVMNNDSISFYYKVSSESSYDYLKFYIDNSLLNQWSGEVGWARAAFAVTPGEHTFRWVYSKDVSVSNGSDAAWVDFIVLPVPLQTTAYAGPDAGSCEGSAVMVSGNATNYVTSAWTTSGDGVFEDAGALTTFYTPGTNDLASGSTELTLTVNGPEGQIESDQMVLSMVLPAIADAGGDLQVCSNTEGITVEGTADNSTGSMWMTSGSGMFDDPSALSAVYMPSAEDIANGAVTLTFAAFSAAPCSDAVDDLVVQFIEAPTAVMASGDSTLCSGSTLPLSVELTGTAPWSLDLANGAGTLTATQSPYTFNVTPTGDQTYEIISVTDATNCTATGSGSYAVTALPAPQISLVSDTSACANHSVTLNVITSENPEFLWMPGGYTTQSITVDSTGLGLGMHSWTVTATGSNSCSTEKTVNLTFFDCTGIAEAGNTAVILYPNPSQGDFNLIPSSAVSGIFDLAVYDGANKLVYSQNQLLLIPGKKIRVSSGIAEEGLYLIRLSGSSGTYFNKLIIKN